MNRAAVIQNPTTQNTFNPFASLLAGSSSVSEPWVVTYANKFI